MCVSVCVCVSGGGRERKQKKLMANDKNTTDTYYVEC